MRRHLTINLVGTLILAVLFWFLPTPSATPSATRPRAASPTSRQVGPPRAASEETTADAAPTDAETAILARQQRLAHSKAARLQITSARAYRYLFRAFPDLPNETRAILLPLLGERNLTAAEAAAEDDPNKRRALLQRVAELDQQIAPTLGVPPAAATELLNLLPHVTWADMTVNATMTLRGEPLTNDQLVELGTLRATQRTATSDPINDSLAYADADAAFLRDAQAILSSAQLADLAQYLSDQETIRQRAASRAPTQP